MLMGEIDNTSVAEGRASLRDGENLLGLTLDEAMRIAGRRDMTVEYTRPVRNASDEGTPRVVRVRNGVLTAAFFCDTVSEVGI